MPDDPAPAPPAATPATDWTPLPDTEPERTIAILKGDVMNALAREQKALRTLRDCRNVLAAMESACGTPDKGDSLRRVLAIGRAYRERAEVPDLWTRLNVDVPNPPEPGDYAVALNNGKWQKGQWTREGFWFLGTWTSGWHDGQVVAYQRVAGPGWLAGEGERKG